MEKELNATYLFERSQESEQEFALPCSESFWTTIFALFLLDHSEQMEPIYVWHYQKDRKPYFTKLENRAFDVRGLQAAHISVEPSTESQINHFKTLFSDRSEEIGTWAGLRPDLVIRRPICGEQLFKYTFIEVKTVTGSVSAPSQIKNYPRLISTLNRLGIACELFYLCSVGGKALDKSVLTLQGLTDLTGRFGVLLWEEVFLKMADSNFQPFGNEINWRKYAKVAFDSHCQILKTRIAPD